MREIKFIPELTQGEIMNVYGGQLLSSGLGLFPGVFMTQCLLNEIYNR